MSNRIQIEERIRQAAELALQRAGYVSALDVLIGIGWLQPIHVDQWRKGRIQSLEQVIQANLNKISYAMESFRRWATKKGLQASETAYLRRTTGPKTELQFSRSGDANIEKLYRTHYISPVLSERKREALQEKLAQAPDLIVYIIGKDSSCKQCNKTLYKSSFLVMEADQPLCLTCAKLDDLVFLPRGDQALTRRTKKYSTKFAVVVKFSQARKRYERQGLLVTEEALQQAESELGQTD